MSERIVTNDECVSAGQKFTHMLGGRYIALSRRQPDLCRGCAFDYFDAADSARCDVAPVCSNRDRTVIFKPLVRVAL